MLTPPVSIDNATFLAALETVYTAAMDKLPAAQHATLERARDIARLGRVVLTNAHEGHVLSSADEQGTDERWYTVNGTCDCPAQRFHPDVVCKHRLALRMTVRVHELVQAERTAPQGPALPYGLRAGEVCDIKGNMFVRIAGLMRLAHERGMQSLEVMYTHVQADCVMAQAVVVMTDGYRGSEAADSTPDNVGAKVKPHWRRMALTRAKARVLRDMLGVDLVAVEELGD